MTRPPSRLRLLTAKAVLLEIVCSSDATLGDLAPAQHEHDLAEDEYRAALAQWRRAMFRPKTRRRPCS